MKKGLAFGGAFLRLEISALPQLHQNEPQTSISAASATNPAESVTNPAASVTNPAESVTNSAVSQLIHGRPVSLLSNSTSPENPNEINHPLERGGGGGWGYPTSRKYRRARSTSRRICASGDRYLQRRHCVPFARSFTPGPKGGQHEGCCQREHQQASDPRGPDAHGLRAE